MKFLSAPTLMVAAVAGMGLYAVYRISKIKSEDVTPEGGDGELALLGDPLPLSTNRFYRARLRVREVGDPPFLSTASRESIQAALEALGFSNVKVFMTAEELPSDWPRSTTKNAGPMSRWFEGQWRLPSVKLPRPPDVEAIWMAKPPVAATYTTTSGLLPGNYRIRVIPSVIDYGAPNFEEPIPLETEDEQ